MPRAAWCSECSQWVWVGKGDGCVNGHPRSCLRKEYEAFQDPISGQPVAPVLYEPVSTPPVNAREAAARLGRGVTSYVGALGDTLASKADSLRQSEGTAASKVLPPRETVAMPVSSTPHAAVDEPWWNPAGMSTQPLGFAWLRPRDGRAQILWGYGLVALEGAIIQYYWMPTGGDTSALGFLLSIYTIVGFVLLGLGISAQRRRSSLRWSDAPSGMRRIRWIYGGVIVGLFVFLMLLIASAYSTYPSDDLIAFVRFVQLATSLALACLTTWYSWQIGLGLLLAGAMGLIANLPYLGWITLIVLLSLPPLSARPTETDAARQ